MITKTSGLEKQASLYLFDLQNLAAERGRMSNDDWEVKRVTTEEKIALEKLYRYTLSNKVLPEELSMLFDLVCQKLNIIQPDILPGTLRFATPPDANYLIAFHKEYLR